MNNVIGYDYPDVLAFKDKFPKSMDRFTTFALSNLDKEDTDAIPQKRWEITALAMLGANPRMLYEFFDENGIEIFAMKGFAEIHSAESVKVVVLESRQEREKAAFVQAFEILEATL